MKCKNCGSESLSWSLSVINLTHVQDGRLKMHDLMPVLVLGCDLCSEDVRIIREDAPDMRKILNGIPKQHVKDKHKEAGR